MVNQKTPTGLRPHNHEGCVARALERAEKLGATSRIQLTPVRRRTLEILLESHKAMGAYEIAERLGKSGLGSQAVVAYRGLEFLMAHGFVHKIEGLNAFVACAHAGEQVGEHHAPVFMVCDSCHKVAEAQAQSAQGSLGETAKELGFSISRTIVEAHGTCAQCAK